MTIRVERDGPVTTVILARPERRNAVDRPTATALASAFRNFASDEEARVAVLWGEGGSFCSGADLKALGTETGNRLDPDGDGPMGPTRLILDKPVIAAISGHAVAGGLELACWCDLRVAEETAVLGVFCRKWGVPLLDGGTVRLPRLIGLSRALDLILTGRPVPAREAFEMGLVNRLVPEGRSREVAAELAHEIAALPPLCLRSDRQSAYAQSGRDWASAMRNEFSLGLATIASGETREGVTRFLEGAARGSRGN